MKANSQCLILFSFLDIGEQSTFKSNIVVSASKIEVRHEFVAAHIGVFEEEQEAFDLTSRLIWQLPLFMPWRAILEDVIWSPVSMKHDLDPQVPDVQGAQFCEGKMPEVSL